MSEIPQITRDRIAFVTEAARVSGSQLLERFAIAWMDCEPDKLSNAAADRWSPVAEAALAEAERILGRPQPSESQRSDSADGGNA